MQTSATPTSAVIGARTGRLTTEKNLADAAFEGGYEPDSCQAGSWLSLRICLSKARHGTRRRNVLTRPATDPAG